MMTNPDWEDDAQDHNVIDFNRAHKRMKREKQSRRRNKRILLLVAAVLAAVVLAVIFFQIREVVGEKGFWQNFGNAARLYWNV